MLSIINLKSHLFHLVFLNFSLLNVSSFLIYYIAIILLISDTIFYFSFFVILVIISVYRSNFCLPIVEIVLGDKDYSE